MNINASIIDQQVRGLAERAKPQLEEALDKPLDENNARSAAFVALCVKVMLDISDEEAFESLTEGGNDFGVDAVVVGDVSDNEFVVTLFQGKYSQKNLEGANAFPQVGVEKAVQAVRTLFDPRSTPTLNPRLAVQVAEIHSRLSDGYIPQVRFLLCNNGQSWKVPEAQQIIDHERFGDKAHFEHVNHDVLVRILQSTVPVKDTLQFAGKVIVEDFNYTRVFIGKVPVTELARLMEVHGDRLLERNIRRYLGMHGNRVNDGSAELLLLQQRHHAHLRSLRLQRAATGEPQGPRRGAADHQRRPDQQDHLGDVGKPERLLPGGSIRAGTALPGRAGVPGAGADDHLCH